MRRAVAALALAAVAIAGLGTGCTRRQEKEVNRIWRDAGGNVFNRVNINTASREDLAALPGLSDTDADNIIKHRPYGSVQGLVRKKVLSKSKYEDIQDYVYAR
jgi:DNA uptake protein ComE-like DNA-binding protein